MCHLFSVDHTLDRVKAKGWQLYSSVMINVVCEDPYLCVFMCYHLHAYIWSAFVCVCLCERVVQANFCVGSPCSLLLSPLCEACPPLDGPGVPAECVEVASSWSLQEAGF